MSVLRNELGTLGGVQFDVVAWAPHEADVDLSFACMFEHEAAGATLDGGLLHLDQALGGFLTRQRAAGAFAARQLDTLHVPRPPAGVRARALMVIGLGDPSCVDDALLGRAASLAAAEAIRLGARSVAFAPNLLDAGIVAPHELHVASAMLRGVVAGLALAAAAIREGFAPPSPLQRWSFDTGPAHFASAMSEFARTFTELASAPAPASVSASAPASSSASASASSSGSMSR